MEASAKSCRGCSLYGNQVSDRRNNIFLKLRLTKKKSSSCPPPPIRCGAQENRLSCLQQTQFWVHPVALYHPRIKIHISAPIHHKDPPLGPLHHRDTEGAENPHKSMGTEYRINPHPPKDDISRRLNVNGAAVGPYEYREPCPSQSPWKRWGGVGGVSLDASCVASLASMIRVNLASLIDQVCMHHYLAFEDI